jgi:hypothetical protein
MGVNEEEDTGGTTYLPRHRCRSLAQNRPVPCKSQSRPYKGLHFLTLPRGVVLQQVNFCQLEIRAAFLELVARNIIEANASL